MINLKSSAEIGLMRKSGQVLRDLLLYLEEKVRPGISTKKLDEFAYDYIKRHGGTPSFLGYGGFPASICTSVDEVAGADHTRELFRRSETLRRGRKAGGHLPRHTGL